MKKVCAVLLIFVCLLFSSCSSEDRIGYKMLSDALSQYSENYTFEFFDMFIFEHTYHTYLSLYSDDDVMLSMQIDEYGNIDAITVTANREQMKSAEAKNAFKNFACAVINCYASLTSKEYSELSNELSYDDPNEYFSNHYEKYSSQRYHFIFSSNSEYIFLNCEYYEIMENETAIINAK